MVAGLDQVEVGLVRRVEGGDLRVGDVDLGLDFLVDQLVSGQRAANIALQIVQRHVALLELVVELLLRVWRLDLRELRVHVFIAGGKVELGGALLQDFIRNHLVQDLESPDIGFFGREFLRRVAQPGLVIPVQVGAH